MNNVTEAEVIKALECCIKGECSKCPLKAMNCSESVAMAFARDLILRKNEYIKKCDKALDLADKTIKAQKAEIEKLTEKQTPIEPQYFSDGYADGVPVYDEARCPVCECDFEEESTNWGCKYCPDCGQALDWRFVK